MKIIEKFGFELLTLNDKLFKLIEDVEVEEFNDLSGGDLTEPTPVIVGEKIPTNMVVRLLSNTPVEHVVQKDHGNFMYNLILAAMLKKHPAIITKNPLLTMLKDAENENHKVEYPFNKTQDQKYILGQVEDYLKKHNLTNISDGVMTITSEFILNALFNAPVDKAGAYLYRKFERDYNVQLLESETCYCFMGHNQQNFVIGCRDPFGSVDQKELFECLNIGYKNDMAEIRKDRGGCGVGLKTSIDNSSGLYLLVEKGKQTTVFATFPIGEGMRKVVSMSKNLHIKFY